MEDGDSGSGRHDSSLRLLRDLWLGARLTVHDFFADRGVDRSSALAYISLLSLVPLLATVAALYRAFFPYSIERLIEMVTLVLPYQPGTEQYNTIIETLSEFVGKATALGYLGTLVFLAIAFRLFVVIETTLNEIWNVRSRRTPAIRVFSFTMLVFWGPVVMGLGSSALLWMQHQAPVARQGLVLSIVQVALPLLGLTMVYWLAPRTGVHIGAALVGGATATAGLLLLRLLFASYIERFPDINIIYGSLTLAVLFLVALFAFWMLVILGAEASYVTQNFRSLKRRLDEGRATDADPVLVAISVLTECFRRARSGEPAATGAELENALGADPSAVIAATESLVDAGLLAVTGPSRDSFVPGLDASRLTLAEAVDGCSTEAAMKPPGEGAVISRLDELLQAGESARREVLERTTFAELVEEAPD